MYRYQKLHALIFILSISISFMLCTRIDGNNNLMTTPKDSVLQSIANDIHTVATNDFVGIESPHLSHKLISDKLLEAARRGAQVQIITDTESANNLQKYFGRPPTNLQIIPVDIVHAKRALINNGSQKITWFGSMNITDDAGQNYDIATRSTNPSFYDTNLKSQKQLDKPAQSQTSINFSSPQIVRSSTKEAQLAKKKDISDFPACAKKPDDYLYFVAYSFNDPEIEKALLDIQKKANKQITLVLDNKCWKNHRLRFDFLKPFVTNNGNVYIFNKDETKKTTSGKNQSMHIKAILRKCGDNALLLMSTGNFTAKGKQNINYDLWQPISLNLATQFKNILDSITKESEKLTPKSFISDYSIQEKTEKLSDLMEYPTRIKAKSDEIIQLIRDGAEVNVKNDSGVTFLMKAVLNNQKEMVQEFIDANADMNAEDENQTTALKIAATLGFVDIAEKLIDGGADINQVDNFQSTPLFIALDSGNAEMAQFLINKGADVNKGGGYKFFGLRNEFRGTTPPMIEAVIKRNGDVAKLLLEAGALVDAPDPEGFTAFLRATESRNIPIINLLASAKANINILNPRTGNTPLMDAFLNNDIAIIEALINVGADMAAKNKNGQTLADLIKNKKNRDDKIQALLMATPFFKANPIS